MHESDYPKSAFQRKAVVPVFSQEYYDRCIDQLDTLKEKRRVTGVRILAECSEGEAEGDWGKNCSRREDVVKEARRVTGVRILAECFEGEAEGDWGRNCSRREDVVKEARRVTGVRS